MRRILFAAMLSMAPLQFVFAAANPPQLLLGDLHYGYAPPSIRGPHRLVMLSGMGNDHMRVDTSSPEAQRWFDYALTLARAFEHGDAKLAFAKAASLDPSCSLCLWGEAYSLGPTINFLVDRNQSNAALALARRARRLARGPLVSRGGRPRGLPVRSGRRSAPLVVSGPSEPGSRFARARRREGRRA